ncbi:hypothetical protein IF1G_02950 [Cordyceps javanica]|uniref:Uncharacterized protein n=1 Tax=Cordyceps javanica TaxID=43265 RepID=A0A545VAX4_9HYPO|nr:hypothetical protein IF1G_02950 [Cordyceps javanica]
MDSPTDGVWFVRPSKDLPSALIFSGTQSHHPPISASVASITALSRPLVLEAQNML